jgi:hypothetical protein
MSKKRATKNVIISTRINKRIFEKVKQTAYLEGLSISEWLRKIVLSELKRSGMLHIRIYEPY